MLGANCYKIKLFILQYTLTSEAEVSICLIYIVRVFLISALSLAQ